MDPSDTPAPAESWLEFPDGRVFPLKGPCSIGRHPDNDLVLDLPALSRRHALLTTEADGYTLSDLHSRNGSFVNRTVITRPVTLRDGDEIRFGDALVHYRCTRRLEPAVVSSAFAATQRLDHMRERACWLDLLVDVVGFGALNAEVGSEAALRQTQTWITALCPLIERHGGHINSYLGDAIFAYWLSDTAQPDDVLATLRDIETWRPSSPLVFRLVVHHGPALFSHSDRGEELTGPEVNFIFRSEKIAKNFGALAMLSEVAMKKLGLEGRCKTYGQSAIDGMSGLFSFHSLPADFIAPAGGG